jgi:GYF domain 2
MNWFYAKDGQQIGPVDFSEIERLRAEGQLTDDTLVWQQGMANWVKLSSLSKPAAEKPVAETPAAEKPIVEKPVVEKPVVEKPVVEKPVVEVPATPPLTPTTPESVTGATTALPDYGDLLCWGIIGILLPCAGLAVYIALIVLHVLEFSAVRKAIVERRLQETDYSKIHPALFILGLVCCGAICYPLFMHLRNRTGYFKPQPSAVWVAIVAIVLSIGINVAINLGTAALQQAPQ